jgi:hypothetical protein
VRGAASKARRNLKFRGPNLERTVFRMQKQGAGKRQKELARQAKQREKAANRNARKKEKDSPRDDTNGIDPDIAGIVPGPQPPVTD